MKSSNTYTLYDSDGTVIGRGMYARDVAEITGVRPCSVSQYANNGLPISGRWSVEIEELRELSKNDMPDSFAERWEAATAPFRTRVIWVKRYEPGVKKLRRE